VPVGVGAGVALGVADGVGNGVADGVGATEADGDALNDGVLETDGDAVATMAAADGEARSPERTRPPRAMTNAADALIVMTRITSDTKIGVVSVDRARTVGAVVSVAVAAPRR